MSSANPFLPRIALVAEGPTDTVVIEAGLKAMLKRPFVLNVLQPERTNPRAVNGWCGVYKWCEAFRAGGAASLEADPKLSQFDMVIVHLDADVAEKNYADCGALTGAIAPIGVLSLPCAQPCPPSVNTVAALEAVLLSWLGIAVVGNKTVLCIPSKALESWLTASIRPTGDALLNNLECRNDLSAKLEQLPKKEKIRKGVRAYECVGDEVTRHWALVCALCTQAASFDSRVKPIAQAFPP